MVMTLLKFAFVLTFCSHWAACGLGLFWTLEEAPHSMRDSVTERHISDEELTPWQLYCSCLFWATQTVTSIGYGDLAPATDNERIYVVVVMLVGSCLWAYVIATLCAVLAAASKDSEGFYEGLEQLQMLLRKRHVTGDLRKRLRTFYFASRARTARDREAHVYDTLSPGLHGDLVLFTNS